jgi:zinc transporter ZupT
MNPLLHRMRVAIEVFVGLLLGVASAPIAVAAVAVAIDVSTADNGDCTFHDTSYACPSRVVRVLVGFGLGAAGLGATVLLVLAAIRMVGQRRPMWPGWVAGVAGVLLAVGAFFAFLIYEANLGAFD